MTPAMDVEEAVRRYASEVTGCEVLIVTRFTEGNRHHVFRASGTEQDVVVRVSLRGDPAERWHAEREAAVLERLGGVGAPRLLDARLDGEWFDAPVMCTEHVDGEHRDLEAATADDLERLGAVVAAVHELPPIAPTTPQDHVEERLAVIDDNLRALHAPLPESVQARVDRALEIVHASGRPTISDRLVLLHGDVGSANVIWSPSPVLIDWEFSRTGDPADEIAYVFGQHGLTSARRAAFLTGYAPTDDIVERVRWWEPVLLLGSALWWLDRWSEPDAPRGQRHYLDQAVKRLDRFDVAATSASA